MDNCEVPPNTPGLKPGYNWDPYAAECQKTTFTIFGRDTGINYRKIHIGEIAFTSGFETKDHKSMEPCPPMWVDVIGTWIACAEAGYLASHAETFEPSPVPSVIVFNTDIGYTKDPFRGTEYETQLHDPSIPFHTKRQIAVAEMAYDCGRQAVTPDKMPKCPPMFGDVQHYWDAAIIAGFEETHGTKVRRLQKFLVNEFFDYLGKFDWPSNIFKAILLVSPVVAPYAMKWLGF